MRLARNFELWEFEQSETATRLQIDNRVPPSLLDYVRQTADMLQRIRDYLNDLHGLEVRVTITSGYRCLLLNRAIGSSDGSDHVQGMAADWRASAFGTPVTICRALEPVVDRLGIGQLINEYPDGIGWVHTSIKSPAKIANRVITITHSGTSVGVVEA